MTAYSRPVSCAVAALLLVGCAITTLATPMAGADPAKPQITILYDAFGKDSAMQKDWGYAALVEYGGKRILFDSGNNPEILAQNAKAKRVDLSKLDFVVMSHRHGDHMGGLAYLRKVNPQGKDLRAEGGIWRLWRRFAEQLLSQGPFSTVGTALFRRYAPRRHAVWFCLAWRELPARGQNGRDRFRHLPDLFGLR